MTTAVVTAIMGGYDNLKPHVEIPGVDWIAFSDTRLPEDRGWEVRVEEMTGEHPRTAAKRVKLFHHRLLPEYERTIWIDGTHEVTSPLFVEEALACIGPEGLAMYPHFLRDCIYAEADASVGMRKYQGQPIWEQATAYRAMGHPEHWGLWECGTIARRNDAATGRLMDAWAWEIERWTYQDQISFPVVARRLGIRPNPFPGLHRDGHWLTLHGHNRDD